MEQSLKQPGTQWKWLEVTVGGTQEGRCHGARAAETRGPRLKEAEILQTHVVEAILIELPKHGDDVPRAERQLGLWGDHMGHTGPLQTPRASGLPVFPLLGSRI